MTDRPFSGTEYLLSVARWCAVPYIAGAAFLTLPLSNILSSSDPAPAEALNILVACGVVVLSVLSNLVWPQAFLSFIRNVPDEPVALTSIYVWCSSPVAFSTVVTLGIAFAATIVVGQAWFYIVSVVAGSLPIIIWWPTSRRIAHWPTYLRARGVVIEPPVAVATAAWYPDPTGRHELRYWDGSHWTARVIDGSVPGTDPILGSPRV